MRCVAHVMGERGPVSFTQRVRSTRLLNTSARFTSVRSPSRSTCSPHNMSTSRITGLLHSLHLSPPLPVLHRHSAIPYLRHSFDGLRPLLLVSAAPSSLAFTCIHLYHRFTVSTFPPPVTRASLVLSATPLSALHTLLILASLVCTPILLHSLSLLFIGRTPSSFSLQSSAWRSPNSPT